MKKAKEFFIKNKKRFIIAVSVLLIIIALVNIYFVVEVSATSNDECLWIPKDIDKDSMAIFFDVVKVGGVTWQAGIRNGDQFLAMNNQKLSSTTGAQYMLNKFKEGEIVHYTVKTA